MIRWKKKTDDAADDVVAEVETQTRQAADLAAIKGQARLTDPHGNPAVRRYADELRDAEHRKVLAAEYSRAVRRHRVTDRRAAEAEKALELIQAARKATDPARHVMALHSNRRRFMAASLAASLSLSVGSATGMAKLAAMHGAVPLAGWIAEVGLTGLATAAIIYRSHIAAHGGRFAAKSWQNIALWALTILPLLVSVVANAMSNGLVGVFCAVGAAAFSLLTAVISDTSSQTLHAQAERVSDVDIAELHITAMGEDLPISTEALQDAEGVDPEEGTGSAPLAAEPVLADWVQDVVAQGQAAIEEFLTATGRNPAQASPEALVDQTTAVDDIDDAEPMPPAYGPEGGQQIVTPPAETPEVVTMLPPGNIVRNQREDDSYRVVPAARARLAIGDRTRAAVAAYQAAHPQATAAQVAKAVGVSERTVRIHRSVLRGGDR